MAKTNRSVVIVTHCRLEDAIQSIFNQLFLSTYSLFSLANQSWYQTIKYVELYTGTGTSV